jgi:hypothetical protein
MEHLLIARRGEVPCPAPEKLCSSVIRAPRPGLHSAKPKIMYDIIERMYPGLRKIEYILRRLFAEFGVPRLAKPDLPAAVNRTSITTAFHRRTLD